MERDRCSIGMDIRDRYSSYISTQKIVISSQGYKNKYNSLSSTLRGKRKDRNMSIIIKKENEMFNMYQNGELIHENLKVVLDKRKGEGEGDIRLPENSFGKSWLSTTKFKNGITEVDLANIPSRSPNPNSNGNNQKSTFKNWTNYLTEEERVIYDDLKSKCTERMNKAELTEKFANMAKNFSKEELIAMLGLGQ